MKKKASEWFKIVSGLYNSQYIIWVQRRNKSVIMHKYGKCHLSNQSLLVCASQKTSVKTFK